MRTPHNDSSSRLHRVMQPAALVDAARCVTPLWSLSLPSTVSARTLYRG